MVLCWLAPAQVMEGQPFPHPKASREEPPIMRQIARIQERNEVFWVILSDDTFGPFATFDEALDFIRQGCYD